MNIVAAHAAHLKDVRLVYDTLAVVYGDTPQIDGCNKDNYVDVGIPTQISDG